MNDIKQLIKKMRDSVNETKKICKNSNALVKKIEKEYQKIVKDGDKIQSNLDKELLKTVQQLDRTTISFIKATE